MTGLGSAAGAGSLAGRGERSAATAPPASGPVRPYAYWIGMEATEPLTAAELVAIEDHYTSVHVPEVVDRNPGFVAGRLWRRIGSGAASAEPPRWLAMYDIDGRTAADAYLERVKTRIPASPPYTSGPPGWKKLTARWRIVWETVSATDPWDGYEQIDLIGVEADQPPDPPEPRAGLWLRCHETLVFPNGAGPGHCAVLETSGAVVDPRRGSVALAQGGISWRVRYERAMRDTPDSGTT